MLGMGHLWPPVSQWLHPDTDDRLIATALDVLEEMRDRRGRH